MDEGWLLSRCTQIVQHRIEGLLFQILAEPLSCTHLPRWIQPASLSLVAISRTHGLQVLVSAILICRGSWIPLTNKQVSRRPIQVSKNFRSGKRLEENHSTTIAGPLGYSHSQRRKSHFPNYCSWSSLQSSKTKTRWMQTTIALSALSIRAPSGG